MSGGFQIVAYDALCVIKSTPLAAKRVYLVLNERTDMSPVLLSLSFIWRDVCGVTHGMARSL